MKQVEVGNIRAWIDDRGEGAVSVDKTWREGAQTYNRRIDLEPGEPQDLLVALDGISNDIPPSKDETVLHKIRVIMQATEHKLYALGIRHRVEIHVNNHDLLDIAFEADAPIQQPRPDTSTVCLGGYGKLVAVRGKRV